MTSPVKGGKSPSREPREHAEDKLKDVKAKSKDIGKAHDSANRVLNNQTDPRGPVRLRKQTQVVQYGRNSSYLPETPIDIDKLKKAKPHGKSLSSEQP